MKHTRTTFRHTLCLLSLLSFLLMTFVQTADAHAYSAGYTTLNLTQDGVDMTYSLDELSVIELTGADTDGNGMLEGGEFAAVQDRLLEMLQTHLSLTFSGQPQTWNKVIAFGLDPQESSGKVVLEVIYPPAAASQTVSLTDSLYEQDSATNYVNLLTINHGDATNTQALSGKYRVWSMELTGQEYAGLAKSASAGTGSGNASEAQPSAGTSGPEDAVSGWYSFFTLGMNHILSGYDHLLFLFSLLIARQTFKQYAAMITAFTVAHSITLTLTVLGIVNVPPVIVEPAIALSICFVAVDNILRKEVSYRWLLTFLFGLIHGMGFADILKEMNLPKSQLAVDLLSFNLGIEAVQITLVALLLPLLALLHRWKFSRRAVMAGSSIAFLLGGIWLIERLAA